jgi:hypothetical protein
LSRGHRRARATALALCALGLGAQASPTEESAPLRLRYGFAPGQSWRAVYEVARETQLGGEVQRDRGVARFAYRVREGAQKGQVRIEARLLSQETVAGVSPLDFSPIAFRASTDARGRLLDPHFDVGPATPPPVPGVEPDPLEYQRMLEQVASTWRSAVFWFPELPEGSLSAGDSFDAVEERDEEVAPGVTMRLRRTRSYRLRAVADGVAQFAVVETSRVDAANARSGIASEERAEGEARFDLALGMWTRHQLASSQHASYTGAEPRTATGEMNAHSVTTIEMQRVQGGERQGT